VPNSSEKLATLLFAAKALAHGDFVMATSTADFAGVNWRREPCRKDRVEDAAAQPSQSNKTNAAGNNTRFRAV
jgi:hypothetical protein